MAPGRGSTSGKWVWMLVYEHKIAEHPLVRGRKRKTCSYTRIDACEGGPGGPDRVSLARPVPTAPETHGYLKRGFAKEEIRALPLHYRLEPSPTQLFRRHQRSFSFPPLYSVVRGGSSRFFCRGRHRRPH